MAKRCVLGNPRGRPSKWNPDKAAAIINRMMDGQDVNSSCRAEGVKAGTFRSWAQRDVGGLYADYARAQALLALFRDEEIGELIQAGGRGARRQAKWRERFVSEWLPGHLQPWRR